MYFCSAEEAELIQYTKEIQYDGMSTFFIVTTSDLVSLGSKTAKKLRYKVHFV